MAGEGELNAAFRALAKEAAQAGTAIGNSMRSWLRDTAGIASGNADRTMDADADSAKAMSAIRSEAGGDLPGTGAAANDGGTAGLDAHDRPSNVEIRRRYLEIVGSMKDKETAMRGAGASDEEVARTLNGLRNHAKVVTRALMDPDEVAALEARNMAKYGDPIGPTPEFLFERYGSWQAVIDAAYRTDPATNALLGLGDHQ